MISICQTQVFLKLLNHRLVHLTRVKVAMGCLSWGSDLTSLAPVLLKLLLIFIAFTCFGFIPVFVVSVLLKMAEHTCGLKKGIDRLLVMASLTVMVTWHYVGSMTFVLLSLFSLFTKLAISLLTTVRMICIKAIRNNLPKVKCCAFQFWAIVCIIAMGNLQVTLGSFMHRLYLKWRKMYPPILSSRAPRKSAGAQRSTTTSMFKGMTQSVK